MNDPRITYIRQDNHGIWCLAQTYNTALRASQGRFIAILEGDDLWLPHKLEAQLPTFDDPSVGMSYGRILLADSTGQTLHGETARRNQWEPPYASFSAASPLPFLRDLLMLRGNVGALTIMFRRTVLEHVGSFWQPSYFPAVDFSTLLRVATISRTAFLDLPLGIWRKHGGQTTDVHGLQYALGHTRVALEHFRSLPVALQRELRITEQAIWNVRRGYLADAYWAATQAQMRSRDWSRSRRYALGTLRWGSTFRRLEGIASLIAAIVHIDLGPLIRALAMTQIGQRLAR